MSRVSEALTMSELTPWMTADMYMQSPSEAGTMGSRGKTLAAHANQKCS
jgi:hypothetical protein